MNKRGDQEGNSTKHLIEWIIVLLILFIIFYALSYVFGWFDFQNRLPSYQKRNITDYNLGPYLEDIWFEFDQGKIVQPNFPYGLLKVSPITYKYVDNVGWYWSGEKIWNSVEEIDKWGSKKSVILGGGVLFEENRKFIESLKNKSFEEGVRMLIVRTVKNDEGGWFYNTNLKVYVQGKEVKYSKELLKDPEEFVKFARRQVGFDL